MFFYFEKAPTSAQNTPCNDAQRKREETNAKQREYRAKKKAEANKVISPLIFTSQTPLSQTELLAKEKKDERNRKQCEWRARSALKKAEEISKIDMVTPDTVMQSLTETELLSRQKKELLARKQREWRAKRKVDSQSVEDSANSEILQVSTFCHAQLTESQEDQHSEMLSTQSKREQRNKYMREYRARKKAKLSNTNGGGTARSTPTIGKV